MLQHPNSAFEIKTSATLDFAPTTDANISDLDQDEQYICSFDEDVFNKYNHDEQAYPSHLYDLVRCKSLEDLSKEKKSEEKIEQEMNTIEKKTSELGGKKIAMLKPVNVLKGHRKSKSVTKTTGRTSYPVNNSFFTFLLVDDNIINIFILKRLLFKLFPNSKTIYTIDSTKVEQLLKTTTFDMIFLDIEMPILSGIDLTKIVRNRADLDKLGLIAVTSRHTDKDLQLYESIGIDHTLRKPLYGDWNVLIDRVSAIVAERNS